MAYEAKNFDNLLGIKGFSEKLLKNHFILYQGYVKNTNLLLDKLSKNLDISEFSELKRRFAWEFNGMRLHEHYFGNLTKNFKKISNSLLKQIVKDFGSYENWEKEFKAISLMRGIGWVILYDDISSDKLFNIWINEHDSGHLTGAVPLLVLDVFEHAYITDYEIKKADYVDAFFNLINWDAVKERFDNC